MLNLPGETWIRFLVWMALGFVVYFAYGARQQPARHRPELLARGRRGGRRHARRPADADDRATAELHGT